MEASSGAAGRDSVRGVTHLNESMGRMGSEGTDGEGAFVEAVYTVGRAGRLGCGGGRVEFLAAVEV